MQETHFNNKYSQHFSRLPNPHSYCVQTVRNIFTCNRFNFIRIVLSKVFSVGEYFVLVEVSVSVKLVFNNTSIIAATDARLKSYPTQECIFNSSFCFDYGDQIKN